MRHGLEWVRWPSEEFDIRMRRSTAFFQTLERWILIFEEIFTSEPPLKGGKW